MKKTETNEISVKERVLTIVSTLVCIVLLPVLLINLTLIAKGFIEPDSVPDVGGFFPMIVLTDSMYPVIESGDLIICKTIDAEEVVVGDVISFVDPAGNGTTIVTHRVTEITEKDGQLSFKTKGDANNTEDNLLVPEESLVGTYLTRIDGAGNIAMFMQSSTGLIVCIGLPLLFMLGYDYLRRKKYEKEQDKEKEALMAEFLKLKAEKEMSEKVSKELDN